MNDMEKNKAVNNFAKRFTDEVISRFIKKGSRAKNYFITTSYQSDISDQLRDALKEVILSNATYSEIEEAINKYCSKIVIVQVYLRPNEEIRILVLRTPKGIF